MYPPAAKVVYTIGRGRRGSKLVGGVGGEVAVLGAEDIHIGDAGIGYEAGGSIRITIQGAVEGGGEEAGLQAGDAEEGLLGERNPLDGKRSWALAGW